MGQAFRNQFSILDGAVTLYQRTDQGTGYQSDSWYAYFKVPGHRGIRRSLRTKDKAEAKLLAESVFWDLKQKAKRGLSLKTKRFSDAGRSFLRDYQKQVEREADFPDHEREYKPDLFRNKKRITEKYLLLFFGNKPLQEVTETDIEDYIDWRQNYWIEGEGAEVEQIEYKRNGRTIARPKRRAERKKPDYSTLNKELTVIRNIFEFARKKKWIDANEIPEIKNVRKPKNHTSKKPGFTQDELMRLMAESMKASMLQTNPKHKKQQKLINLYMMFLAFTGVRVSEAKNIKISDCRIIEKTKKRNLDKLRELNLSPEEVSELQNNASRHKTVEYLAVFVQAKGKQRELIGQELAKDVYNWLIEFHKENAARHGWKYHEDLPLFMNEYGKPVKSFKRGIDAALKRAGLLYDKTGKKRTAGAFRKYYITRALLNGVNVAELAKQCGNSIAVISEYYNEIDPTETPEKFVFDDWANTF